MRVVVGANGRLVLDRKGAGRGAWLCQVGQSGYPRPECVVLAKKRGAFARALKRSIDPADVDLLARSAAR